MAFERDPAIVQRRRPKLGCGGIAIAVVWLFVLPSLVHLSWNAFIWSFVAVVVLYRGVLPAARAMRRARAKREPALLPASARELRARAMSEGGGAYLRTGDGGGLIFAPPESAVLVLAGPRAGKTTSVVIPALLGHAGAAVATSTKPEVLAATLDARRQLGRAWFFDLQGYGAPAHATPLRWSPIRGAEDWQAAQLVAEAMAGSADVDTAGAHWRERAGALIAACLHAAARSGQGMRELIGWVLRHDADAPLAELDPGALPYDVLEGIKHTGERERASIFSTAAGILRAYRSEVALTACEEPNFDPDRLVASTDTVFIAAPAQEQRLLAPLIVGLVTALRAAAYRHHWQSGPQRAPLLLLLDECANLAPLPDLPAMLSEGGGQGVQTVSIFQDMSQTRRLWPKDADGMMSLFGAKVIMAGVADKQTLEQLSLLCGEYDREIQTLTETGHRHFTGECETRQSWTTRRERKLPPDEIARLPKGQALIITGSDWQIVPTVPYHQHPLFAHLANSPTAPKGTLLPGPQNGSAPDGVAVTERRSGEGKEAKRP